MAEETSQTIVVLGGTGLIGRHVVSALHKAGLGEIVASHHIRPSFRLEGVKWLQGDLADPTDMKRIIQGARVAVLCAGRVSTSAELRRDPVSSVLQTLRIGVNALEAAAQASVQRLVMISSCTGYPPSADPKSEVGMFQGDPPAAWFGVGWMHRFLEKQLEWYSTGLGKIESATVLRLTMVYGPYGDFNRASGHFVPSMINQVVARERPIEVWGDGSQTRNILHAADVGQAVVAALSASPGYAAYNVAAPASVSVNEVLKTLVEVDGFTDAEIVHRLDKAGGVSAMQVSAEPFKARFSWRPEISMREGLAATAQWYRSTIAGAA
jgi:nucleoside-diphosphate-sugar epimerase